MKEILSDKDLKSMPGKQLIRLYREEQKKADEFKTKYEKLFYWVKNSGTFTKTTWDKDGNF